MGRNLVRANELDGRTWERYSISVWSDIRKTQEEARLGHPAIFPLELVIRLVQCFTTREDKLILDPFAGAGSTPIAAELMGKVGVGIELSQAFCGKAQKRQPPVSLAFNEDGKVTGRALNGGSTVASEPGERRIYCDDARNLLKYVDAGTVDLVVTSPPYWDILLQERSADQKEVRHYGDAEDDLGKVGDYGEFLEALKGVFALVYQALRPGKYCIVIVMDLRKKSRFFPLHSDVAGMMQTLGFIYDDMIIWDRRHEYNNLRPLGYPYRFRINRVHEFILIFQKPLADAHLESIR
jgi:DNA modification methylase